MLIHNRNIRQPAVQDHARERCKGLFIINQRGKKRRDARDKDCEKDKRYPFFENTFHAAPSIPAPRCAPNSFQTPFAKSSPFDARSLNAFGPNLPPEHLFSPSMETTVSQQ